MSDLPQNDASARAEIARLGVQNERLSSDNKALLEARAYDRAHIEALEDQVSQFKAELSVEEPNPHALVYFERVTTQVELREGLEEKVTQLKTALRDLLTDIDGPLGDALSDEGRLDGAREALTGQCARCECAFTECICGCPRIGHVKARAASVEGEA